MTLTNIERLPGEDDGEEEAERDARHAVVLANARRTRELAERAQAKLEAEDSRG